MIHIFGAATWPRTIAMVMEYLPGGSLAEFVEDQDIVFGSFLRFRFGVEIASGLTYLHNVVPKRLIHGDLKAENVLLTENLNCKITDFGSSVLSSYTGKTTGSKHVSEELEFTPIYAAPEMLSDPTSKINPALDVYSFSIIIYVLLKREPPITNRNSECLYLDGIKRGQRPSLWFIEDLSKQFDDHGFAVIKHLAMIMQQCWSHNPSDRPPMADVHQRLLQIQANIDEGGTKVAKEVATALKGMNILKPVQSNYRCAPLNMFHPPSFQLFQPGK